MARTGKRKVPKDPTKEARIEAAIRDTLKGIFDSFRSAAIAHINVPPQTVRDRASGKHGTRHSLLSEAQETVLVDWCHHNSDSATPLHSRTLRGRMLEMVGVYAGKQWVRPLISRYPDIRSMAQNDVYALLIRPRMKA
ncbi:hypothetical protein M405DRAFT_838322 [Rhizopogon salebrosus TDB-379]|nr:hypothetical protein M405DRAFT_838322 [Rhizopogon salebrosus TDB-379]